MKPKYGKQKFLPFIKDDPPPPKKNPAFDHSRPSMFYEKKKLRAPHFNLHPTDLQKILIDDLEYSMQS